MKLKTIITTGALATGIMFAGQSTVSASEFDTDRSIVDYLYHIKEDHSFGHRKQLSEAYGMQGYTGTGEQNLRLLTMLKADRGEVSPQEELKTQQAIKQSNKQQAAPQTKQTQTKAQVQQEPKQAQPQGKTLIVEATAYTAHHSENGYSAGQEVLTADGFSLTKNPNAKVVAADTSILPLGTRIYVEGYGEAVVRDRGGAIKGNRIDVLMPTDAQANAWGRKQVKVTVLGK